MKYNSAFKLILFGLMCAFLATSCVKEGPMGPEGAAGKDGKDGKDGKNSNETCIMCHTPAKVDQVSVQFKLSKHYYGEAAFEEAGREACAPCHASEGFKYVVEKNIPSTYLLNASTGKYSYQYAATSATAYGPITCNTCHSKIHATYTSADLPALTTTAAVPLGMWGGTKTVNLTADGGVSNLCVKCHQPRPQSHLQTSNFQDWASVIANPNDLAYDSNNNSATTNKVRPSYRMHIHYGSVGAIYAGVGGIEFAGTMPYTSSAHRSVASCVDCHMGAPVGRAGGHTFTAKGNLTTCNATGCHSTAVTSTSTTLWVNPRKDIKTLLDQLAAKLTVNGIDILNRNTDSEHNLWYGLTTNNYDGYLNIFDPNSNPDGSHYNSSMFQNPSPSSSWPAENKAYNLTLPKLSLTNAQYGALINFQLVLREYSLGIHNYKYAQALLTNSIAVIK